MYGGMYVAVWAIQTVYAVYEAAVLPPYRMVFVYEDYAQDQRAPTSAGGHWVTTELLSSRALCPSSQIPSLSMNARRRSAWERLCRLTRNTRWQPRNTVGPGGIWRTGERAWVLVRWLSQSKAQRRCLVTSGGTQRHCIKRSDTQAPPSSARSHWLHNLRWSGLENAQQRSSFKESTGGSFLGLGGVRFWP